MRALRVFLVLSAAVVLAAPAASAAGPDGVYGLSMSAAKKKVPRRALPPAHIACTVSGCQPTPPGCRPEMGRTWDGTPTGFDIVVCPRR